MATNLESTIFDLSAYHPQQAYLENAKKDKKLLFQINPQTVVETVRSSVESVSLINSNLPRRIINGTEGRRVTFTALFHGLVPKKLEKTGRVSDKTVKDRLNQSRIPEKILSGGVSLVPFGANIARGIRTIADLAGGIDSLDNFRILTKYPSEDIQQVIDTLFSMQVSRNGKDPVERVRIRGYKGFGEMDFYITEVTVNRRLFDKNLNTQFAEISITLEQVGSDNSVGRFFR